MKQIIYGLFICFIFPSSLYAASYDTALAKRVVDGDTLQLKSDKRIRLIGIDTPEKYPSKRLTHLSKRIDVEIENIQRLGRRASQVMEYIMQSASYVILLEYDLERKDKYGRDLAYVYVPYYNDQESSMQELTIFFENRKWLMVNALMIKKGFAQAYFIPPNTKHQKLFKKLETEARRNKVGFWQDPIFDKMLVETEKRLSKYR